MAQLNQDRYKPLGSKGYTYGQSDGLYEDRTNGQLCLVLAGSIVARFDATGMTADLEVSGEARGNILRRGASAWEVHAAKAANQLLAGDGTDIVSQPVTGDLTLATGGGSLAATVTDLTITSEARGDLLRRGAASWERASFKAAGSSPIGDGTDIVSANTAALMALADEYKRNRCFVNFIKQPQVPIHAKNTMAIVTAANSQEDFFRVNGHYFEMSQGAANTALAAAGLTPDTTGWLMPGDDTAADWMEFTKGISLGSAASFLSGTDAFFMRIAFLITTRANHTHLYAGFRQLGAYADAKTNTDHLAAYDNKAAIGISTTGGVITRHTSLATTDAALNAAHDAAADADILALEVSIAANRVCTFKIGHATPAGATAAQVEAGRLAAIADLATDATLAGTAITMTNAINLVPYWCYGMAGTAAVSNTRLLSFESDYQ